jgi:hypothetical protein
LSIEVTKLTPIFSIVDKDGPAPVTSVERRAAFYNQ